MEQYIFGIDHGNGNMKTRRTEFPCGVTKQQVKPSSLYADDVIAYKGNYYVLNVNSSPYMTDKTKDENCFILTLFAFAKEIKARYLEEGGKWENFKGFVGKDVILAAGLPPAHFEKNYVDFKKYFEDASRYGVEFTYNGKPFSFHIKDIKLYPQCYAAAMTQMQEVIMKYRVVYFIDIGAGTTDLMGLVEGKPDRNVMMSREIGISPMKDKIIDDVINDYAYTLDGQIIEDVLSSAKETVLDYEITEKIKREAQDWTVQIINQMHSKVKDFRTAPTIFMGGGIKLLKPYLSNSKMFGKTFFIEDTKANAQGYEIIAGIESAGDSD